MIRKFTLKTFFATVVGALALVGTPAALADTVSNGTLSASASLTCSTDPCTTGSIVTASGSVTNQSGRAQRTSVTITLSDASGAVYVYSASAAVGPGKTIANSFNLVVSDSLPRGDYTLTVGIDGISASSTLTIS